MQAKLRNSRRKPIHHTGWIVASDGEELQECVLSDVSETGARIGVPKDRVLPDDFTLLLTRDAKTRRKCRVIWREGAQLGVTFDRAYR